MKSHGTQICVPVLNNFIKMSKKKQIGNLTITRSSRDAISSEKT